MAVHKIETIDDLHADRSRLQKDLEIFIHQRTKLQNKIRRANPEEKVTLREEKKQITDRIIDLRKRLKCNFDIEERSEKIQQKLDLAYKNEDRNRQLKAKTRPADAR